MIKFRRLARAGAPRPRWVGIAIGVATAIFLGGLGVFLGTVGLRAENASSLSRGGPEASPPRVGTAGIGGGVNLGAGVKASVSPTAGVGLNVGVGVHVGATLAPPNAKHSPSPGSSRPDPQPTWSDPDGYPPNPEPSLPVTVKPPKPSPTTSPTTGSSHSTGELESRTFNYSGSAQTFTVPAGVTSVTVTAAGAQGGQAYDVVAGTSGIGGKGALVVSAVPVTPGETLVLMVGGEGGSNPQASVAGFNGGAAGGHLDRNGNPRSGGGGGGASDVRVGGSELADRVVVAGGGGGGAVRFGDTVGALGGAGDLVGGTGQSDQTATSQAYGGLGGTQSAGGAGGVDQEPGSSYGVVLPTSGVLGGGGAGGHGPEGSDYSGGCGGGGGGGYFGGGGGAGGFEYLAGAAGGGGSSYSDGTAKVTGGENAGNGSISLAWND